MNKRWKMNRIGFVNFWLYDEEDFEFEDGKLLLRGQNGSGKSITTQSFIPFVLDGDRTPSRLDPFGSSDRRMEYYFLGEEGKEESTGYLFLEFRKGDSGEYRTIGIGQKAKRGKSMDFWGFVILDGRRIGYNLWLYKEVGSNKIPRDKREMKAELGEDNFFTDSQSEYKKHVNQYIFGFRKEEQYEQFIKLLVKVRAPKLSKEFKPTKVYEILNDSLQTLTDEDLRPMVDAMEKMDEIQDSQEMLNRAFDDVKIIRNEYTRYNQYMLAKKALGYLGKKQEVEKEQAILTEKEQRQTEAEEEQKQAAQDTEKLTAEKKLKETERNALLDPELEDADRKLEKLKAEYQDAAEGEQRWEKKIEDGRERIREEEYTLKRMQEQLELRRDTLKEKREELDEQQEILQWEYHEKAKEKIGLEEYEERDEITEHLQIWKNQLAVGRTALRQYEVILGQYEEAAGRLEETKKKKAEKEQRLEVAEEHVSDRIDAWITEVFHRAETSTEWHPEHEILLQAEQKVKQYETISDGVEIQRELRADYERQRQQLADEKNDRQYRQDIQIGILKEVKGQLQKVQAQQELEPERDETVEKSRASLAQAGITAIPFYRTVEFAKNLNETACARLEAQLQMSGMLDALVVTKEDFARVKAEHPEFLDAVLQTDGPGNSHFTKLTVSDDLPQELKVPVLEILSNIYEEEGKTQGICFGADGSFRQGILAGKANKKAAEYVGYLARKRRKEQKIQELLEQIESVSKIIEGLKAEIAQLQERMDKLQVEYQELPDFSEIQAALSEKKELERILETLESEYLKQQDQEHRLSGQKNQQYQEVLKLCKMLPYGRTAEAYEEACDAAEEYGRIWQSVRRELLHMQTEQIGCLDKKERIDQYNDDLEEAFIEKRTYSTRAKACEIQIRQLEEYLKSPELLEKANRLKCLKEEIEQIDQKLEDLKLLGAALKERLQTLQKDLPEQKEKLQQFIIEENALRNYFEEELDLKLILNREGRTVYDCAREAVKILRESDKNREPGELLQALHNVYLKHNGSLASYGTSMEECFGGTGDIDAVRKRVRIISTWNGKKVYLEEFYNILRNTIEETELLIQKKDRELFEDILSQTISQQLTDRIAESRRWAKDMSKLMQEIDTSMGLSFSLEWKPCKADNDKELDTADLEQILLRDRELLTLDDIEKVAGHFRSKIRVEKAKLEETGTIINYMELVRDALDYRKWFEFQMFFRRGEETKKPLTNAAFNRFSGGEKAMAMYVPLFGAVNAQYQKAENKDHPRIVALDEAFAGVDDKNIKSMFELVHKLDFDYIMNSQALWGCFETVKGLRIAELHRPENSQVVSVIRYTWNGQERILDEQ
ncbi:MAG: TIGR02680 family protein [Lachnospiraceae bacterium]|nr:TIGR02680 family protein [Lachnospiraceae bacterium]